jgi:hypothetical protein
MLCVNEFTETLESCQGEQNKKLTVESRVQNRVAISALWEGRSACHPAGSAV